MSKQTKQALLEILSQWQRECLKRGTPLIHEDVAFEMISQLTKELDDSPYICYIDLAEEVRWIGPRSVRFKFADGVVVEIDPLYIYQEAEANTTLNDEYVCKRCREQFRITNHDEPYAGSYCELCYEFLLEEEEIDD